VKTPKNKPSSAARIFPLILLLWGWILGAAGQNIVTALVGAWLLFMSWRQGHLRWSILPQNFKNIFIVSTSLVCWFVIATWLNAANPDPAPLSFIWGHLHWLLTPIAVWWYVEGGLGPREWQWLKRAFLVLVLVWAGVSLTQYLFAWPVRGDELTVLEGGWNRSRAFYSHPLTLAYAAILLWPIVSIQWLRYPRNIVNALVLVGVAIIIFTSRSRTIQVVAFVGLVFNYLAIRWPHHVKLRWGGMIAAVAVLLGLLFTKNPVSAHLPLVNQQDRFSDYPDDRLAFWDAHWQMVRERPLLGHGIHLERDYRKPFYEKLGLGDFKKQYEAHNQFLAITAEGGLIALMLFLGWTLLVLQTARHIAQPWGLVLGQSIVLLWVAALTQNAFQDSEVRYGITLIITVLFLVPQKRTNENVVSDLKTST